MICLCHASGWTVLPDFERYHYHMIAFTHSLEGELTVGGEGEYQVLDTEYGPALEVRDTSPNGLEVRLYDKAVRRAFVYRILCPHKMPDPCAGQVTIDMLEPYPLTLRFM